MNVILVCVDNFQEYILINIKQLIRLKHEHIFVITNTTFFERFDEYKNQITLVPSEDLIDHFYYNRGRCVDNKFRNGFWGLTSKRFFLIFSFIRRHNLSNVFHIENDVLLYYNCNILLPNIDTTTICVPADSYNRSIASIMFIPNYVILGFFLKRYCRDFNDMVNLSLIQHQIPNLFSNFPICSQVTSHSLEQNFVTKDFLKYKMIFDAAAIGQYLGGVDPRNTPGDTIGFINETSVIQYNMFDFKWLVEQDNIRRPFITINDNIIPIFNLHIDSKDLAKFI